MHEFDKAVMEILSANPKDVPFAALYHVESPSGAYRNICFWGSFLTMGNREETTWTIDIKRYRSRWRSKPRVETESPPRRPGRCT